MAASPAGGRSGTQRVGVGFHPEAGRRARARVRQGPGARALHAAARRGVRAALQASGIGDAEISVVLMDDEGIARINARHLGHEGVTDVIAFPLWAEDEVVSGDICIGVEQALRQAGALGVDPVEEVVRLAVHGTLHVLGQDHPAGAGRERSAMWALQERIVAEVMSA